MAASKHILICPLNWGLGHATRCIPLIQTFLNKGHRVSIASDGAALELLKSEYPALHFIELPAYNIRYKSSNMFVNIAPQVPKLLNAIRLERKMLESIMSKGDYDVVISDNRYGIYTDKIPTIFMTHQLNIAVPNRLVDAWVRRRNRAYISRYDECWVPDFATEPSLAGTLSHSPVFDNVHYVGPLSTMQYKDAPKKYDIIVVLSGLEPQRSYFEQAVVQQVSKLDKSALIVAGVTGKKEKSKLSPSVEWQSYMNRKELNQAILASEVYIGRSGYSSLMDLVQLNRRKVILVPTPGQTEQEYLAERFAQRHHYVVQQQKHFDLSEALDQVYAMSNSIDIVPTQSVALSNFIDAFMDRLEQLKHSVL